MIKKLLLVFVFGLYSSFLSFAQKPGSLSAVEFDGTDDYILVPDNSALNPTSQLTVEAWIKADGYATTNYGNSIFCKHGWATGNKGYVLRCGDNGKLNFNISNASGTWVESVTASVMKTGVWYHVAGTFNGDTIATYINGVFQSYTLYSGVMSASTGLDAKIGDLAYTVGGSRLFKGQIDEVRVWNKALNKATLRDWMCRKVTSAHPYYSNLAAYYKLDDGTGVDAKDKSSNANTGTLTNGPKWVTSGAALGDSSAYVYSGTNVSLQTKFGDIFTLKNLVGAPSMVHTYVTYDASTQPALKNVLGAIDSTHYFGVFYETNPAVKFDINYNFKNLNSVKGIKKCGVNMFVKIQGNAGTWDYTPSKLYDVGDSLVIKKQTKNEFVMALYQTDSTKLLTSVNSKNWFCGGDSLQLVAAVNDSFNFVWYKNGTIMNGKTKRILFVNSDGIYKVKITRKGTSCSFISSSMAISSRSTPVTWTYSINTCENNDSIKLIEGSPTGGYFTGKWITANGYFHPKQAGAGNHTLFYNFVDTNNCINKVTTTATLMDTIKLSYSQPGSVCTNAVPFGLGIVSPTGGNYSGNGVSGNTFNAATAGLGNHSITYRLTNSNTCVSKAVISMAVYKPDSTSVVIKDKGCPTDEPIPVHVYPAGGILKGSAVIGQIFYPLFASKGYNWMYYTISDSHQCEVKDSAKIYIAEITKASISKFSSICDNASSVKLTGGQPTDSGYYWVEGAKTTHFNPSEKGKGLYKIEYKVVNYFGCRDSAMSTLRVNASPAKPLINVSGNTLTSSSPTGNQWLDQKGPVTGANQQTFKPGVDGYYFVKVTNDSNCSSLSDSIQFVKVGITMAQKTKALIYPNPSPDGIFFVRMLPDYSELMVTDLVGKELMHCFRQTTITSINLNAFGSGTYIISIKSNGQWFNQRLVVL